MNSITKRARVLACLCAVGAIGSAAGAAVDLAYSTPKTTYTTAPGSQVVVDVYLTETVSGTSTSILAGERGIFGYDVSLTRTAGVTTITGASANTAQFSLFPSATFSPASFPTGVATAAFSVSSFDDPGATGLLTGSTRSILLGSFTLTAAPTLGATSNFRVADWDILSSTVTNNNTVLDTQIAPVTFTVTTAVVPEPGLSLPVLGLLLGLSRRRRPPC